VTAPTFERYIGKRRAAPAACPVCGASSTNPWVNHPDLFKALYAIYLHPNKMYFICEHESAADRILKHANAHVDPMGGRVARTTVKRFDT